MLVVACTLTVTFALFLSDYRLFKPCALGLCYGEAMCEICHVLLCSSSRKNASLTSESTGVLIIVD